MQQLLDPYAYKVDEVSGKLLQFDYNSFSYKSARYLDMHYITQPEDEQKTGWLLV